MAVNVVALLGTIFAGIQVVLELLKTGKKVPDDTTLELLSATASLVNELGFCKDVHHAFHSFLVGQFKNFCSVTIEDFGEEGTVFRLQSNNPLAEDHRNNWDELGRRFAAQWRPVDRHRTREMATLLSRAARTSFTTANAPSWGAQPPDNLKDDAETFIHEFNEMLQCSQDFVIFFDRLTQTADSKDRDSIRMVPAGIIDVEDKAEDVMIHADGAIVASVAILAEVNRIAFSGRKNL